MHLASRGRLRAAPRVSRGRARFSRVLRKRSFRIWRSHATIRIAKCVSSRPHAMGLAASNAEPTRAEIALRALTLRPALSDRELTELARRDLAAALHKVDDWIRCYWDAINPILNMRAMELIFGASASSYEGREMDADCDAYEWFVRMRPELEREWQRLCRLVRELSRRVDPAHARRASRNVGDEVKAIVRLGLRARRLKRGDRGCRGSTTGRVMLVSRTAARPRERRPRHARRCSSSRRRSRSSRSSEDPASHRRVRGRHLLCRDLIARAVA